MADTVLDLPCGHAVIVDHDRGTRGFNCVCGATHYVTAVSQQAITYEISAAKPQGDQAS